MWRGEERCFFQNREEIMYKIESLRGKISYAGCISLLTLPVWNNGRMYVLGRIGGG